MSKDETRSQRKEQIEKQLSGRQKKAMALMQSTRGQFVVSEALCLAIETLKNGEDRDESNDIADMELLLALFPLYRSLQAVEKDVMAAHDAENKGEPDA